MHTSWRGTLAQWLLAGAAASMTALATALTIGLGASWAPLAAWTSVFFLAAGCVAMWRQVVEVHRLRRSLGIGLTHHLRTSLTHVQTFNEMLILQRDSSEDQRREWLEVVGREAQRLGSAVENVLYLVQDRRVRALPNRGLIDLGMLLEDVASAHATAAGHHLRLDVDPPAGIMVEGDRAALRQALDNLFECADRVASPGAEIRGTAASDGSIARVVVAFDAESRPCPVLTGGWEDAEQNGLERETSVGFGLELAVVRHVARCHGGRAKFVLRHGRAGYTIELPLPGA